MKCVPDMHNGVLILVGANKWACLLLPQLGKEATVLIALPTLTHIHTYAEHSHIVESQPSHLVDIVMA